MQADGLVAPATERRNCQCCDSNLHHLVAPAAERTSPGDVQETGTGQKALRAAPS